MLEPETARALAAMESRMMGFFGLAFAAMAVESFLLLVLILEVFHD